MFRPRPYTPAQFCEGRYSLPASSKIRPAGRAWEARATTGFWGCACHSSTQRVIRMEQVQGFTGGTTLMLTHTDKHPPTPLMFQQGRIIGFDVFHQVFLEYPAMWEFFAAVDFHRAVSGCFRDHVILPLMLEHKRVRQVIRLFQNRDWLRMATVGIQPDAGQMPNATRIEQLLKKHILPTLVFDHKRVSPETVAGRKQFTEMPQAHHTSLASPCRPCQQYPLLLTEQGLIQLLDEIIWVAPQHPQCRQQTGQRLMLQLARVASEGCIRPLTSRKKSSSPTSSNSCNRCGMKSAIFHKVRSIPRLSDAGSVLVVA